MHRSILRLAVPSVAANITVPLLGIVDLAIAGHVRVDGHDAATVVGALAVGTLIFNMVYWVFAFLRISVGGLTAQACGHADEAGQRRVLRMGATVGAASGLAIVALQWFIGVAAHWVVAPSDEVWQLALAYYNVRVWAAPAVLVLFAAVGWFVGMQNTLYPLVLAVVQNVVNIVLSLLFVFVLQMGIEGVALGTLLSQYVGLAVVGVMLWRRYRFVFRGADARPESGTDVGRLSVGRFFSLNLDALLRMLCLIAVTSGVTAIAARQGDLMLATTTLLMQVFTLYSYFTDGFAAAGEALVGKTIGERQAAVAQCGTGDAESMLSQHNMRLRRVVGALFLWGAGLAAVFVVLFGLFGQSLVDALTDDGTVRAAASAYVPWVVAIPMVGTAAFLWDGIFIGAVATRHMLAALAVGTLVFFAICFLPLAGVPDAHRLWLAFDAYLLARGVYQTLVARRVLGLTRPGGRPCPT